MKTYLIFGILLLSFFAVGPDAVSLEEASVRRLYPETDLVSAGEPAAWVIYPSSPGGYRELAAKIVAAVKAKTGVDIQMLPDTEVTEVKHPVLLDPYRSRNLILLGRLGINRAIWGVYNRFLCAEDGYYPGGDGYVLRTASGVYTNGANTIIAGGSSDKGAARAADKLAELIAALPYKDGRLVLPWLLDVELGGECKTVFDQDERMQMARAFPGDMASHADHPVKRFYENIMSYYWTGREPYLKLGLRFLDLLLDPYKKNADVKGWKSGGVTGHYAAEFFVRAYDMVDDSGKLSAEQIKTTDRAIVDGFYNTFGYDANESSYRTGLKKWNGRWEEWKGREDEIRPVDDILDDGHQNAIWLADKIYADFIIDTLPETAKTAHIRKEAQIRRSLYVKAFDGLIGERWRRYHSGDTGTVPMTFFRYALEMERYELFFDSGNARQMALYYLARVANPSGLDVGLNRPDNTFAHTDYALYAGIVASYFRDGELKYVIEKMPGIRTGHYSCYINGVHTYRPGAELASAAPQSLTGATFIPLQPVHYRHMQCALPYAQTYNFATIRGGFGNEDYLLLCGGQDLPGNTILRMVSSGQMWLCHTAERKNFNQNALYISRLSMSKGGSNSVPPAARLDHIASASEAALISSTLPGYSGADWNRQIVWITNSFFVVFDKVTAREADQYLILANWRPNLYTIHKCNGQPALGPENGNGGHLEGDRWVVRGAGQEFMMVFAGNNIQPIEDADVDPVTRLSMPVYRQRIVADLKPGESASIANLMFARAAGSDTDYELRQAGDGGLLVRATNAQLPEYYIGAFPSSLGKSDAPLVVLTTNRLTAFNAGTLEIHGKVWADHEPAKTREVELSDSAARETLKALWNSGKEQAPAAAAKDSTVSAKGGLRREWRYTGAQRPGLIPGVKLIGTNTWDLGRIVDLSQISAITTAERSYADRDRGLTYSGSVHSQVLISVDGQVDSFRPFRGEVVDVAVPSMLNYGRIQKQEKACQTLRGEPQKARYVKVVDAQAVLANHYLFFDAGQPDEGGDPVTARVVEMRGQGRPDILVYPNIWPGFRGMTRLTHSIFAVDPEGHARWGHEIKWRIFFVRALDRDGTGRKKIFVGSLDNNVYVYDGDGKLEEALTLNGRIKDTDGYPLASSIGLWQPDKTGRRKLVLPRYHCIGYLERDGRVEGHARPAPGCTYWINDVLEVGLDYTGDGIEDSVAMATSEIIPLTQGTIGGQPPTLFLPNDDSGSLSGSPTLAFHLFGAGSTNLFVARQNLIVLFDLKTMKWLVRWTPGTPITAAAALPEHRQILVYTREGLLWRITLGADFTIAGIDSAPVPMAFKRFAVLDRKQGTVVAASPGGLFKIGMDNSPTLLAPGSFIDVDVYPSAAAPEKIIAVDKTGAVEAYLLK